MTFSTNFEDVQHQIQNIDAVKYGKTRNYTDGDVTYLSPYISRGVISTKQVLEGTMAKGYKLNEIESFVKELCWRDYFQRVWQHKDINKDIRQSQVNVLHQNIPVSIVNADTTIYALNKALIDLYQTGYMHNHLRMYVASLTCNIGRSHWLHAAQWMYYHLLDGDWASNACSWQWVAGANSSKKYFANQENINKFTKTDQRKTFLDTSYEHLENMAMPDSLQMTVRLDLNTQLPISDDLNIEIDKPTLIYNYYNLDPLWYKDADVNRILLLEPHIFEHYPISPNCLSFFLQLAKNIEGIQVYVGHFNELISKNNIKEVVFKEHPLNHHYKGKSEARDWICSEVNSYYPSFFGYWKQVEKFLKKKYQ